MLLAELEETYIKLFPKLQKLQLIADITKMLQEEEELERCLQKGGSYPLFTPTIAPDDSAYKAAYQLQPFLEEQNI